MNGASVGSDNGLNTTLAYQDGAFSVGAWDTDVGGGAEWDGLQDEMRFSTTLHSAAWHDAEYANQNSPTSFYTVGAVSTSSATAYLGNFTYTAIGNISSSTDAGPYTYAETGKTNPHAATGINGVSLTYDDNGNLTNHGTSTYTWDYRNRLTSSNDGSATTTYGYDHTTERVKKTATSSTVYANQFYEATNASTTKYVFAGDLLVAYIEADGEATTTISYVHPDHLGGTNVVTDETGATELTQAYYPFGSERLSDGTATPQRGFIGEYADNTGLSYLNARYYEGSRGQFISQDPVFQNLGVDERTQLALLDPQLQNSYSYARDNPIRFKDSEGEFLDILLDLGFIAWDTGQIIGYWSVGYEEGVEEEKINLSLDIAGALTPGATGLGMARRAGKNGISELNRLNESSRVVQGSNVAVKGVSAANKASHLGSVYFKNTRDIHKAGKEFVGRGATTIKDRNTNKLVGYISKDSTKVYRIYDGKKGSANLEYYKVSKNGERKKTKNVHLKVK